MYSRAFIISFLLALVPGVSLKAVNTVGRRSRRVPGKPGKYKDNNAWLLAKKGKKASKKRPLADATNASGASVELAVEKVAEKNSGRRRVRARLRKESAVEYDWESYPVTTMVDWFVLSVYKLKSLLDKRFESAPLTPVERLESEQTRDLADVMLRNIAGLSLDTPLGSGIAGVRAYLKRLTPEKHAKFDRLASHIFCTYPNNLIVIILLFYATLKLKKRVEREAFLCAVGRIVKEDHIAASQILSVLEKAPYIYTESALTERTETEFCYWIRAAIHPQVCCNGDLLPGSIKLGEYHDAYPSDYLAYVHKRYIKK